LFAANILDARVGAKDQFFVLIGAWQAYREQVAGLSICSDEARIVLRPVFSPPSPPLHAKTKKFTHAQPDDPLLTRPSIPVCHLRVRAYTTSGY
jgi:hypothetical protein